LAPQLWMLSWQEMSHYVCKKIWHREEKRPTQLSLDDNLTRDYIRIWPFDFEYSMAFIMYINKCATICVYLLGIIQIVIGKIQKVRCAMVKLKGFFFESGFQINIFCYQFKCEICDYTCSTKSNTKKHFELVHEGKKSFKCEVCGYCCSQKVTWRTCISS
jgi:hypothetical protein